MPMMENVPVYWCAMGLNLFLCALLSWMLLSREPEVGNGKKGKAVLFGLSFLLLGGVATVLSTLLLDEDGDYVSFMTRVMNVVTILAAASTIGVGIYALAKGKGGKHEEKN